MDISWRRLTTELSQIHLDLNVEVDVTDGDETEELDVRGLEYLTL